MALLFRIKGLFLKILPKKLFYLLARFLGYLWFYILRVRRRVAIENVCMTLGVSRKEAEKIVLESMVGLVTSFLEFVSQRSLRIRYVGFNEVKEVIFRGGIIVTAHTGNWDVLEQVAYQNNIRLGVLSRKSKFLPLQKFVEYIRGKRGEIIFEETTRIPALVRFVKSGGVLGLVIDQNMPPEHGRPALFFGREVNTTYTPQILSLRTGLPIIPVFVKRIEDGDYEVIFYELQTLRDKSDESIKNSMNYLNKRLEDFIRSNPTQWLWVHRRFKPLQQLGKLQRVLPESQ